MGISIAGDPSLPTLSQLEAWQTEHFGQLADWCEAEATRWENSFTGVHELVKNADWDGDAKDAAVNRTERDVSKVRGAGWCLRDAAPLLRMAGENEGFAKTAALRVVADAKEAGLIVGENLSFHDPTNYTSWEQFNARRDLAMSLAQDLHREARSLLRIDQDIAERLPAITAALRDLKFDDDGRDGHVQLVDHYFPLKPPRDWYPTNEVVREATDLDGNHVVLRRGYYDGKRGFGFDKMFWRHGITNPEVFVDLISHSRPIIKKDGELIYEVPIVRVHCSTGIFGGCQDTNERLTIEDRGRYHHWTCGRARWGTER